MDKTTSNKNAGEKATKWKRLKKKNLQVTRMLSSNLTIVSSKKTINSRILESEVKFQQFFFYFE